MTATDQRRSLRTSSRQRNSDAERAWFAELYPRLHRVACVAAPVDVSADDLVQEALVRYLQHPDPTAIASPAAYLTAAIVNLASSRRRSWSRRARALTRLGKPMDSCDSYPSDLSDLKHLTPIERAVLYLHHVEGRTFADVGHAVELSPEAARQVASRARRRLANTLEVD